MESEHWEESDAESEERERDEPFFFFFFDFREVELDFLFKDSRSFRFLASKYAFMYSIIFCLPLETIFFMSSRGQG